MTDKEIVLDAARAVIDADTDEAYDAACVGMVEALAYARSIEWWNQFSLMLSRYKNA
jgi:hypothetical protein